MTEVSEKAYLKTSLNRGLLFELGIFHFLKISFHLSNKKGLLGKHLIYVLFDIRVERLENDRQILVIHCVLLV